MLAIETTETLPSSLPSFSFRSGVIFLRIFYLAIYLGGLSPFFECVRNSEGEGGGRVKRKGKTGGIPGTLYRGHRRFPYLNAGEVEIPGFHSPWGLMETDRCLSSDGSQCRRTCSGQSFRGVEEEDLNLAVSTGNSFLSSIPFIPFPPPPPRKEKENSEGKKTLGFPFSASNEFWGVQSAPTRRVNKRPRERKEVVPWNKDYIRASSSLFRHPPSVHWHRSRSLSLQVYIRLYV